MIKFILVNLNDFKANMLRKRVKLVFVGLAGMIDPPRQEAKKAVKLCKRAGIKVMMATGDHKLTATAIAKEFGILESDSEVLTGTDMDGMSDDELDADGDNFGFCTCVSDSQI